MKTTDLERLREIVKEQGWEILEITEIEGTSKFDPDHYIKLPISVTVKMIQQFVEREIGSLSVGIHFNPPTHQPPESEYLWLQG